MKTFDFEKTWSGRSSGVLMHMSSLPGQLPLGNCGRAARDFVDILAGAKQSWWQMLPINPIGEGNSPYSTVCGAAGEPLLIDLEQLVEDGLLTSRDIQLAKLKKVSDRIDYAKAKKLIAPLIEKAFLAFSISSVKFRKFCAQEKSWLDDYALFCVLTEIYGTGKWFLWPDALRKRDRKTLQQIREQFIQRFDFYRFQQYCFFSQWQTLKDYANARGVGLVGDLPIFVGYDSVDVWCNQKYFWMDAKGRQTFVAGVPPDYFNAKGQRWGNAVYRWSALQKDGFSWWLDRFGTLLRRFDLIRIDHFIGFHRYWEISAKAKTAVRGKWRLVPGDALFARCQREFGALPFIAEDLGLLTKEVTALREKYKMPGMKVLQFAFANDGGKSIHAPHNYDVNSAAYPGTHDNDTVVGWYQFAKRESKKKKPSFSWSQIQDYFADGNGDMALQMIAASHRSRAKLSVIAAQDVLGLSGKARMNIPGTSGKGNWSWRVSVKELNKIKKWENLARLTKATGRI